LRGPAHPRASFPHPGLYCRLEYALKLFPAHAPVHADIAPDVVDVILREHRLVAHEAAAAFLPGEGAIFPRLHRISLS
jgi:hypothetical protein